MEQEDVKKEMVDETKKEQTKLIGIITTAGLVLLGAYYASNKLSKI